MDTLMDWAKAMAVFGGVIVGIFAVFSTSWVWLRHRVIGLWAIMLCGLGTVLIVASLFREVSFAANQKGVELKLAELQTQLKAITVSLEDTKEGIRTAQRSVPPQISAAVSSNIGKELSNIAVRLDTLEKKSNAEAVLMKLNNIESKAAVLDQKIQSIDAALSNPAASSGGSRNNGNDSKRLEFQRLPMPAPSTPQLLNRP
jgi:hypothetical protein